MSLYLFAHNQTTRGDGVINLSTPDFTHDSTIRTSIIRRTRKFYFGSQHVFKEYCTQYITFNIITKTYSTIREEQSNNNYYFLLLSVFFIFTALNVGGYACSS